MASRPAFGPLALASALLVSAPVVACRRPAGFVRPADGLYDLRARASVPGDVIAITERLEMTGGTMTTTADGQTVSLPVDMTQQSRSEVEISSVSAGELTGFRQKVLEDTTSMRVTVAGRVRPSTEQDPLVGKTILHELREGKWTRAIEGGASGREKLGDFDSWDPGRDAYPAERVRVGHEWTLSGDALQDAFLTTGGTVTGRIAFAFRNINELSGQLCASMEATMDVEIRAPDSSTRRLKGAGLTERSLVTGIDLTSSFRGSIELSGRNEEDGVSQNFRMSGPIVIDSTAKLTREGSGKRP